MARDPASGSGHHSSSRGKCQISRPTVRCASSCSYKRRCDNETHSPKAITWWIALVLGVLGLLGYLGSVSWLNPYSIWLVVAGLVLMLVATRTGTSSCSKECALELWIPVAPPLRSTGA
jgi:hypothetical protein